MSLPIEFHPDAAQGRIREDFAAVDGNGTRVLLLQLARGTSFSDVEQDVYAPIGVAYVGAALQNCGYSVEIGIHPPTSRTAGRMEALPEAFQHPEKMPHLFGISATGNEIDDLLNLAKLVKSEKPGVPIIAGGYCSMRPDLVLSNGAIDAVVIGEGEQTVVELASAILHGKDLSSVSGIAYNSGGVMRRTKPREAVANLDDLAVPQYSHYPATTRKVRVYASRGCPYRCTYCSIKDFFATSKIRYHGSDYMRRVIRNLQEKLDQPIELVFFNDDEFLLNSRHLAGMADVAREMKFRICFQTRTQDVVKFARELERHADVIYQVHMGVEAFSQSQLDRWQKATTVATNREALQILSSIACSYYPYLILSDHKTTPAELAENCNGILDLPPSRYELDYHGNRVNGSLSPLHWGLHLNRYKTFLGDVERSEDTVYLEAIWEYIWSTQKETDRLCGLFRHSHAASRIEHAALRSASDELVSLIEERVRSVAELAAEIYTLNSAEGIIRSRERAVAFNGSAVRASVVYMCGSLGRTEGVPREAAHAVV